MSRVLAGPYCTQLFADLGADVWKLEPFHGDDTRSWGPPFVNGESAYFLSVNKGKKSFVVNLKEARGQDLVRKLASQADILVENFKVGDLARYGLDYATLSKLNPQLIYCSITGFGQTGPRAKEAGYDAAMQGMSGLMSMTGAADGEPAKVGVAVVDVLTGLHAAVAILAALHERHSTKQGKHLDIALFDVALASLVNQVQSTLLTGRAPKRMGSAHPQLVPYQSFKAKDDYFVIAVGNDVQFKRLCEVLGLEHLWKDERLQSNAGRVENREVLIPVLAERLQSKPKAEWLALLNEAKIPAMPVNTLKEALQDEQVAARGLLQTLQHSSLGTVPGIKSPVSDSVLKASPVLAEHTNEILQQLGLDEASLSKLEEDGVILRRKPDV